MTISETPRLIECLCPRHLALAERQWPAAGPLSALTDECSSCRSLTEGHYTAEGVLHVRSLPDVVGRAWEHHTATHEAGHAVVALLTGHPVNYVQVEAYTDNIQTEPAGHMNLGPYEIDVTDHLAMLWAGQEAGLRWLRAHDLDTRANRVDVRFLGWDDLAKGDSWVRQYGLPLDAGRGRCLDLLDVHWPAIELVADALLLRGRLTGAEIADLAGCGVPS